MAGPAPAPQPNIDVINDIVAKPDEATRLAALKTAVQGKTLDQLEGLAKDINEHATLQAAPEKLKEFKAEMKERIEAIKLTMAMDKRLAALEGRLELAKLLAEPKKSPVQRVTDYVVDKAKYVAEGLGAAGGWVGESASIAYKWISENTAWLSRTVVNAVKRGAIHIGSTFIPPGLPIHAQVAAWKAETLAQMDAVDAIWTVVSAEKEIEPQNNITFDGKFNKSAWVRLSKEGRTPEKIQEMTQHFITEQRKITAADGITKLGMAGAPIEVKMEFLMDPTKAAEVAKQKQEAEAKRKTEELQTAIANVLPKIDTVTIGTSTNAKKGGAKWSIAIERGDIDETAKKIKPGTNADHLVNVINALTGASAISLGGTETKLHKGNGGIEVQMPNGPLANAAAINSLIAKLPSGGDHIASVNVVRDVTLNNRVAWSPVGGVGSVKCSDSMLTKLNTNFEKLRDTVTTTTPTAQTFYEWKAGSWEIVT